MKNTSRKKQFWQSRPAKQLSLAIFAAILTLAIFEISLRAGGFILSSVQEYRNLRAIKQAGRFRIMCLGESTTQNQYPRYLEEILNARGIGIKFSVIDKGLTCSTSDIILSHLNEYLDKYDPDMVVTMMGTNDRITLYYQDIPEANNGLFRHYRTYRFARILYSYIIKKIRHKDIYEFNQARGITVKKAESVARKERFNEFKKAYDINRRLDPKSSSAAEFPGRIYGNPEKLAGLEKSLKDILARNLGDHSAQEALGWFYGSQRRFKDAEQAFGKVIELDPRSSCAYEGLGWIYRDQGKLLEAEQTLKKAIELKPDNFSAYTELIRFYRDQGDYEEAKKIFRIYVALNPHNESIYRTRLFYKDTPERAEAKRMLMEIITLNPKNDAAYEGLGWILREEKKAAESEAAFRRAIELNPNNVFAYEGLGSICGNFGRFSELNQVFQKIIEINPGNNTAYNLFDSFYLKKGEFSELERLYRRMLELAADNDSAYEGLGWMYNVQRKLTESKKAFENALEINPQNDLAIGGLITVCHELGEDKLSREYSGKLEMLRGENNPTTTNDYRALKKILDKRKVRLVCAQYPMRSIASLRNIFANDPRKNIIFVDNEQLFKDAVRKEGYPAYFKDMFAGDFGHCTEKGNRLLAGNIADAILREAFRKQ